MRKENSKPRIGGNRKRQTNPARPQSAWLVSAAILSVGVVLGYLVMQTQKRLEIVQSELQKVRQAAVQAKAWVVDLEQAAGSLKRELKKADVKRNQLRGQLGEANSRIEQLGEVVATAHNDWRTRLESLRSELESAKHSAEQAEAEAAGSKKQVASLGAKLDEANDKRHALQTELQLAQSDVKQLRSELYAAQSELFGMRYRLRAKQDELGDSGFKAKRGAFPKQPDESEQTGNLSKELLDATAPLTKRGHTALDYDSNERDYLIRTIVFEASGETEIGKAAVAHVILNRKRSGRWGDKIREVVTRPWQFEPWMTRKEEIEKLRPNDPRYMEAAEIADAVLAGRIPDPTAGATHFLNPVVVRQRRGGSLPPWADGDGYPIGRHVFYSPERDGAVSRRPTSASASQHSFSDFSGSS